jgi:hypothetical protein
MIALYHWQRLSRLVFIATRNNFLYARETEREEREKCRSSLSSICTLIEFNMVQIISDFFTNWVFTLINSAHTNSKLTLLISLEFHSVIERFCLSNHAMNF